MEEKEKKKRVKLPKTGNASKFDPKYTRDLWKYYTEYDGEGIPQMSEFARRIGVTLRTLENWTAMDDEFADVYEECMAIQREMLINGSLTEKYNSRTAMFLLSANHRMREYTRIKSEQKDEGGGGLSASDRRLLAAMEERLSSPPREKVVFTGEIVNEGAYPAEEVSGNE